MGLLCSFALSFVGAPAFAAEKMGVFSFSEMFLTPSATFQGEEDGGFGLQNSWLGFQWSRGDNVHGIVKLGTVDLIKPAVWFNPITQPSFGLTEIYMKGESPIGDMALGLVNLNFGFESVFQQWGSILPDSLARKNGWFVKRDYGVQLSWETKPWSMSITSHNGESAPSNDGRFWTTGHWMYSDPGGFRLLVSAQVGNTKPQTTSLSTEATAQKFVFLPNESAKIRMGSLALIYEWQRTIFVCEGHQGQILQAGQKHSSVGGRCDSIINLGGDLGLLLRHEQIVPEQGNDSTTSRANTIGMVINSKDQLYSFSMYGTRQQEDPEVKNDSIGVLARIRSNLF